MTALLWLAMVGEDGVSMTELGDLEVWAIGGSANPALRAVGWLSATEPYSRGLVTEAFFESLLALLVDPWERGAAAGRHPCPFCRFSGGPASVSFKGTSVRVGSSNLFVPADGVIFVAPSLVAHYIDAHEYAPPAVFVDAVLACPPMRSMAYLSALKSIAGAEWMRR